MHKTFSITAGVSQTFEKLDDLEKYWDIATSNL